MHSALRTACERRRRSSRQGRWRAGVRGLSESLARAALTICCATTGMLALTGQALADDWFPHPAGATWTYFWTDTTYNTMGTTESLSVSPYDIGTPTGSAGCGWQLTWTGDTEIPIGSSGGGSGTQPVIDSPDNGTMCFTDQDYGLVNTDWSGTSPQINEPPLCASSESECPNSLSSLLYDVIWGSRDPVLSEPLLRGTSWSATGGGDNSVTSVNQYLGLQKVTVPALPKPVSAAVVQSQIALAGTPGDDYGSGIRTTWWVYGVGPVKLEFDHVDGSVTDAELESTDLTPLTPRADEDYFPLQLGLKNTYEWTNSKHMRNPEIDTVSVAASVNRSARLAVASVSGPIKADANYIFSLRLDGLRNTWASSSGASIAKFPTLGHDVHFFNPLDLMTYGFNPVIPAYPVNGTVWKSGDPLDLKVFGVTGRTWIMGVYRVHVPAGTFQALVVRSDLTQKGHPFGSGERTMWFAPGRGLVRLVFRHDDGSTTTVQLIK